MIKYVALLAVVLFLGCASTTPTPAGRAVATGDKIDVEYTGSFQNGTIFDTSVGRDPFQFTVGQGQVIKGFDDAVLGMHAGEEKNVTIPPENAYGLQSPANIIEIPIGNVPNGTKVGDTLYAGQQSALVLKLNTTTAVLDINHPLAGKTLVFRIRLVKIY